MFQRMCERCARRVEQALPLARALLLAAVLPGGLLALGGCEGADAPSSETRTVPENSANGLMGRPMARMEPSLRQVAPDTFAAPSSLLDPPFPDTSESRVPVVVEIPAGTVEKWEVTKPEGYLALEHAGGQPRRIRYLPYPASYGMIPGTTAPRDAGGDGDPLDVILLGPTAPRGTVVAARPIGVLRLRDDGERDDKIIAVPVRPHASPFADIRDTPDLERAFPGVLSILETWFVNYEEGNTSGGVAGAAAAFRYIEAARMASSEADER